MKRSYIIVILILALALFAEVWAVVGIKSQLDHIGKEIEHLDEEVDEAKSGVERLLKRKVLVPSGEQAASDKLPKAEVEVFEYDFGVIKGEDGVVKKDFTIKNTGKGILVFGDITSSCGCTSGVLDKTEVKQGESAVLTVSFDPNFHAEPSGKFERVVFIPTNDPENEELEFTISVDIE